MNSSTAAVCARRSASLMRQTIWADRGFPVDPVWIAGRLGMSVIETELPDSVLGSLVKDANRDAIIMINRSDEPQHKRFNCAHKIGHFADHQMQQDDFYKHLALRDNHPSDDPKEVFANEFSLELLMPENEIQRLQDQGVTVAMMARHFGVADEIMQIRMSDNLLCA